jgi:hypothetical protein
MEHPSTWLSDDDGWTVDVYETGLVIFSHQSEEICRRTGYPVARLWTFGCFCSRGEGTRYGNDYPPNHTLEWTGPASGVLIN